MTNMAVVTGEAGIPRTKAEARSFVVSDTVIGPVYAGDESVGCEPSVV